MQCFRRKRKRAGPNKTTHPLRNERRARVSLAQHSNAPRQSDAGPSWASVTLSDSNRPRPRMSVRCDDGSKRKATEKYPEGNVFDVGVADLVFARAPNSCTSVTTSCTSVTTAQPTSAARRTGILKPFREPQRPGADHLRGSYRDPSTAPTLTVVGGRRTPSCSSVADLEARVGSEHMPLARQQPARRSY